MKTPKSKLTAEPPPTKKDWNLPKKIFFQRQRRSHSEMVGEEGYIYDTIKSLTCQVGDPQTGK